MHSGDSHSCEVTRLRDSVGSEFDSRSTRSAESTPVDCDRPGIGVRPPISFSIKLQMGDISTARVSALWDEQQ